MKLKPAVIEIFKITEAELKEEKHVRKVALGAGLIGGIFGAILFCVLTHSVRLFPFGFGFVLFFLCVHGISSSVLLKKRCPNIAKAYKHLRSKGVRRGASSKGAKTGSHTR